MRGGGARLGGVTHSPSAIRALLAEHGLEASRALGQNFVADANTVRKIVRLAGVGPGDRVVEVGAGPRVAHARPAGGRRRGDGHRGRPAPAPVLRSVVEPRGATVVEADAMQLDWAALLGPPTRPAVVAGGQPAVQHRHAAGARPARGRAGHRADARDGAARGGGAARRRAGHEGVRHPVGEAGLVGRRRGRRPRCPPSVFIPQPRVESALVDLRRHAGRRRGRAAPSCSTSSRPASTSAARCCAARWPTRSPADALEAAGIRPEARAEELTLADWRRLAAVRRPASVDRRHRTDVERPTTERRYARPCPRSCSPPPSSPARCGSPACGPTATTSSTPRWSASTWPTRSPSATATASRCEGADPDVPADDDNLVRAGPAGRRPHRPRACSTSGSRPAPGSAAARPTPRPCCAGPASPTSTLAAQPRRRRALLPGGRPGPGHRHRRAGRARSRSSR